VNRTLAVPIVLTVCLSCTLAADEERRLEFSVDPCGCTTTCGACTSLS